MRKRGTSWRPWGPAPCASPPATKPSGAFSKDKKSTAEHVKVLTSFDDATKDELMKAVGCVLTYNVKEVKSDVKEKFLNFMMAVRS